MADDVDDCRSSTSVRRVRASASCFMLALNSSWPLRISSMPSRMRAMWFVIRSMRTTSRALRNIVKVFLHGDFL